MKNFKLKLAAVAFLIGTAVTPAFAGKGGSAAQIRDAIRSTSTDAIIAEIEQAESLICGECATMIVDALMAMALVQAITRAVPELDHFGHDPESRPMSRP